MEKSHIFSFLSKMQERDTNLVVTFLDGDSYHLGTLDFYRDDEALAYFSDCLREVPHDYIQALAHCKKADTFNLQTEEITQGKREWYDESANLPDRYIWTSSIPSEPVGMTYYPEHIVEVLNNTTNQPIYKGLENKNA